MNVIVILQVFQSFGSCIIVFSSYTGMCGDFTVISVNFQAIDSNLSAILCDSYIIIIINNA